MIADRQRLYMTRTAGLAAFVFAFVLLWTPVCEAQSFSVPGRVMRHEVAPPQQAPLPPGHSRPTPQAPRSRDDSDWGYLFKKQVERCWERPDNPEGEKIEAIFSLRLKRDGMVDTVHIVSGIHTTAYGSAYQASSLRAILDCQPYDLPQDAYDEWRFFEPVFTERVR